MGLARSAAGLPASSVLAVAMHCLCTVGNHPLVCLGRAGSHGLGCTLARARTHVHTSMYTHAHVRTRTRMQRARARTHTHTHVHVHKRAHMHARALQATALAAACSPAPHFVPRHVVNTHLTPGAAGCASPITPQPQPARLQHAPPSRQHPTAEVWGAVAYHRRPLTCNARRVVWAAPP